MIGNASFHRRCYAQRLDRSAISLPLCDVLPVMRVTARSELPSTKAATTALRSSVLNLFVSAICVTGHALSIGVLAF